MRIEQTSQALTGMNNAGKAPNREDAALKKACKDFESMLVGQVMKQMRQTVQKSDLFGSSEKEDMFQGMLDDQMATDMSKHQSLGIADAMYKQLSRQKTAQVI